MVFLNYTERRTINIFTFVGSRSLENSRDKIAECMSSTILTQQFYLCVVLFFLLFSSTLSNLLVNLIYYIIYLYLFRWQDSHYDNSVGSVTFTIQACHLPISEKQTPPRSTTHSYCLLDLFLDSTLLDTVFLFQCLLSNSPQIYACAIKRVRFCAINCC